MIDFFKFVFTPFVYDTYMIHGTAFPNWSAEITFRLNVKH